MREVHGRVRTRTGLLALAVAVSAGIHTGLIPEHLQEMPRLGYSFIVASVLGIAIAGAHIVLPPDPRIAALAGIFCLGQILSWVLFVTIPVPLFPGTPEGVEAIAIVSKGVEAVGWVLALGLMGPARVAGPRLVGRGNGRLVQAVAPPARRRAPRPDVGGTYAGGESGTAYVGRGINGG